MLVSLAAAGTHAQDALRGKRLYHDTAGVTGASVSCVECHGGLPGALHGLPKAAGNPAAIEYAVNAISQMAPLRGRLGEAERADLAAYIARHDVELRLTTEGPAHTPWSAERLEFPPPAGGSPPSVIRISNAGQVPVRLLSSPVIEGPHAGEFVLVETDCVAGLTLTPSQSCRLSIAFNPRAVAGLRTASVGVRHDWIRGALHVALIGRAPVR
jgi:cytochrome c553